MTNSARVSLSESEARSILAPFGLPFNKSVLVETVDAAVEAAEGVGYPAVLKGDHAALAHKTEAGVVKLGLSSADAVRVAAREILDAMPPGGRLSVQESISGKREILAGFLRDDVFGPCVSIGVGGIFAEALEDVVFRAAPLSRVDALAAIDDLNNQKILGAYRGMPPVDRATLADIMVALAEAGLARPDIAEIDVNPLIIEDTKPVAVDALVVLAADSAPGDET